MLQCSFAICGLDLISSRSLFDAKHVVWFASRQLLINEIFIFFVWRHGFVDVVRWKCCEEDVVDLRCFEDALGATRVEWIRLPVGVGSTRYHVKVVIGV